MPNEGDDSESKFAYGIGVKFPTDESQRISICISVNSIDVNPALENKEPKKNRRTICMHINEFIDGFIYY